MREPFIFGLPHRIDGHPFLDTETLYNRVGHNTGNLAFQHAIHRLLGGHLKQVPWSGDKRTIETAGDVGVIPAANQFGAHVDYGDLAKSVGTLSQKLVMIGLGSQSDVDGKIPEVPKGTVEWVKEIANRAPSSAPNIAVRGAFTLEVLEHYGLSGRATVLGCPSLFINPDPELGSVIERRIRPPKRFAVAAGHQSWKHLRHIEASLGRLVSVTHGSYVGQHALPMLKLTRGEAGELEEADLRACRDYVCPEMDVNEFVVWADRHGSVFFDVESWIEHYRRFDFVVGTRIHGVMLALQAGIPGLCIAHDSRTLELCRTMMVPHVVARDVRLGISRDQIMELFQFDGNAFDRNRRMLARRMSDFLAKNGLMRPSILETIASEK